MLTFYFQIFVFLLLPIWLDGSAVHRQWQTHTEVAEYERFFLRSSAICQRFLGGEQWWLWGLQTDLTASLVVTFHWRFSYKCAQRDFWRFLISVPWHYSICLYNGSQQLSFSNVWGSVLHLAHQSDPPKNLNPGMEQAKYRLWFLSSGCTWLPER